MITGAAYSGGSNYLLTRETNSNGQSITYDYSGSVAKQYGLPTTTTTPGGTSTTASYSGTNGRVTQVGGVSVATLGAISVLALGSHVAIGVFGATGLQAFALGSAVYDISAMFLPVFYDVEMEPIEYTP